MEEEKYFRAKGNFPKERPKFFKGTYISKYFAIGNISKNNLYRFATYH
jgi:hypothetical protein